MDYFSVVLQGTTQVRGRPTNMFYELLDPMPSNWLLSLAYSTTFKELDMPPQEHQLFWDCGAWGYRNEEAPIINKKPLTAEAALDYYLEYSKEGSIVAIPDMMVLPDDSPTVEERKIVLTLKYAREFFDLTRGFAFKPIAVVHGNTFANRMRMLDDYLDIGYEYIAHGGVAVNRDDKGRFLTRLVMDTYQRKKEQPFYLHMFGVSGIKYIKWFQHMQVDSVDGSGWLTGGMRGTYYIHSEKTGKFTTYNVNSMVNLPHCACKACETTHNMPCPSPRCKGSHILHPGEYGCGPNNLVRCAHNLNNYMMAYNAALQPRQQIQKVM